MNDKSNRKEESKKYKDYNNRSIKRPVPEKGMRPTIAPQKKDKKNDSE